MSNLEPITQLHEDCQFVSLLKKSPEIYNSIMSSIRYETIPSRTVYQIQDTHITRYTFIIEGNLLQCDNEKNNNSFNQQTEESQQEESSNETDTNADQKSLRVLFKDNNLVLSAWEICDKKPAQFQIRTGDLPCKVASLEIQLLKDQITQKIRKALYEKSILLEQFLIFQDLSYSARIRIAEQFQFLEFKQYDILLKEGVEIKEQTLFFLVQGEFSISKKLRKYEQVQNSIFHEKDVFTLQKIFCLSQGEMLCDSNNSMSTTFRLHSEGDSIVGIIPLSLLRWLLKKCAAEREETFMVQLKESMERIEGKSNFMQQQLYLQGGYRFQNKLKSEEMRKQKHFISTAKDLFITKAVSNFQEKSHAPSQSSQIQQTSFTSPKRHVIIRKDDSLLLLEKIESKNQQMNSFQDQPSQPRYSDSLSIKDLMMGHINMFSEEHSQYHPKTPSQLKRPSIQVLLKEELQDSRNTSKSLHESYSLPRLSKLNQDSFEISSPTKIDEQLISNDFPIKTKQNHSHSFSIPLSSENNQASNNSKNQKRFSLFCPSLSNQSSPASSSICLKQRENINFFQRAQHRESLQSIKEMSIQNNLIQNLIQNNVEYENRNSSSISLSQQKKTQPLEQAISSHLSQGQQSPNAFYLPPFINKKKKSLQFNKNNLNCYSVPFHNLTSLAHPLSHMKKQFEIEQLVKEKETILNDLKQRQYQKKSQNNKSQNLFDQRKHSLSAHANIEVSNIPFRNSQIKKAVEIIENNAYFSLDFGTDTVYRKGFKAKMNQKLCFI